MSDDSHLPPELFLPLVRPASDVPDLGEHTKTIQEFTDWCNRQLERLRCFKIRLGEQEPAFVAPNSFRLLPEIIRQCRLCLNKFGAEIPVQEFSFPELPLDQTPTVPGVLSAMEWFLVRASAPSARPGILRLIADVETIWQRQ